MASYDIAVGDDALRQSADGETPGASLRAAVAPVPAGAWAVGVSGGADSVALLRLLRERPDLSLRVVHLNHQTRGADSDADAAFVAALADRLRLPCDAALRSDVERGMPCPPANPSARYRAARAALFGRVVAEHALRGVLLAHHADDQAETILHRLLRGSAAVGLGGMAPVAVVAGLTIARPLLGVRRAALRDYLERRGQPWREDASNASDRYARNRVRKFLAPRPALVNSLLDVGEACADLRRWTRAAAVELDPEFPAVRLAAQPCLLARESARRWLLEANCTAADLSTPVLERLIAMAADAATPAAQQFPGGVTVRRARGRIRATRG